jgi:hypothetical protein
METTATKLYADLDAFLCLDRATARPVLAPASQSPSAGGVVLGLLTKPGPSESAAACRDGRRASCVVHWKLLFPPDPQRLVEIAAAIEDVGHHASGEAASRRP